MTGVQTCALPISLEKEPSQCTMMRQRLIDRRLIVADGRGFVRFNLPYLGQYLLEEEFADENATSTPGAWLF